MTREEKIQFIAEQIARNENEIEDVLQDVGSWPDEEIEDYLFTNFDSDAIR